MASLCRTDSLAGLLAQRYAPAGAYIAKALFRITITMYGVDMKSSCIQALL